jgi:hypothetical protein
MAHNLRQVHSTALSDYGIQLPVPLSVNHCDIPLQLHPFQFLAMASSLHHVQMTTQLGCGTQLLVQRSGIRSEDNLSQFILLRSPLAAASSRQDAQGAQRPHGSSHICSLRPRWVSSSRDETIRRWNVAAGEPMAEALRGHNAEVTSVAVSPDGPLIASASCNRTVRILGPRLVPTRRVQ